MGELPFCTQDWSHALGYVAAEFVRDPVGNEDEYDDDDTDGVRHLGHGLLGIVKGQEGQVIYTIIFFLSSVLQMFFKTAEGLFLP